MFQSDGKIITKNEKIGILEYNHPLFYARLFYAFFY
jgi:hypothetical protein